MALLIVAFGYSLLNVAVRLLGDGFSPLTQVYLRVALAFVVSLVLFARQLRWSVIKTTPGRDWLGLGVMGIIGYGLMVYFITIAVLNAKIANVTVIFATLAFFIYLYSVLFLKKKIVWTQAALLMLSVYGVMVIGTRSLVPTVSGFGYGELMALLAAAAGATYAVGRKFLSAHLNNSEVSVLVMGIAAATAFVLATLNGEVVDVTQFSKLGILMGLAIGAGFNIIATFFENYAFKHLDPVLGGQILLTENFFGPLVGFLMYQEVMGSYEVVGALLIVISVFVAQRWESQRE